MGPVVQLVVPDAAVVVLGAAAVCATLVVAVAVVRSRRRRRAAQEEAFLRSREEVQALSRKVEELSQEIVRSRRAADQEREYVITSMADAPEPQRPAVGRLVEDQLVHALAQQPASGVRGRWTDVVVRAVALGHGARRALSADVLDRAAAEAHVARRRSRRARRRQVRRTGRQEVA